MKALSIQDRPREKLFRLGAASLGDNELVAIIVGSGSRRVNALALANDILETTGGLHGMPRTSVDELRRLDGMGTAKAAQVLAAVELGRRTLLRCPPARLQFLVPRDAAAYLLRSEEHTSELQSQSNLVCRLLLEKKKSAAPRAFSSSIVFCCCYYTTQQTCHNQPRLTSSIVHTTKSDRKRNCTLRLGGSVVGNL